MEKLKIEYIDIDSIKPYENNPRNNDKAIDYVADSIKNFGFKVPIIIDENNVIVTGHTRVEAAKKLNIKEVPVIKANDLTKQQIKAFRLADNKVSDYSIWDNKKLLQELEELNFDIFTGFEKSELFEDIKIVEVLDEEDNSVLDDNKSGVIYEVSFKTQNRKLIEKIKELIDDEQ
jgi:hypothetical protein